MGTITLTDPVVGTTITAGLHATNNATLQTLLNGGIDNGNMAAGFQRTIGTFASGPPVTAADGDIWVATSVGGAVGQRWVFQYNAASPSPYKWEFIGGAPAITAVDVLQTTASTSYVDLATAGPTFTLSRGGDYIIQTSAQLVQQSATTIFSANTLTTGTVCGASQMLTGAGSGWVAMVSGFVYATAMPAGTVSKMQYSVGSANSVGFQNRRQMVTPVRVS